MSVIIYERKGRIAYITLNRPEVLNAMNQQTFYELGEARIKFRNDTDYWVCIVSGAGDRAFSVGNDIQDFLYKSFKQGIPPLRPPSPFAEEQMETSKPFIAAIDGWCLAGGLEFVLNCCDIRIATAKSKFGIPEPKIGLSAARGATYLLPAQIPYAVCMEMLLTGDPIAAQRAYEVGLINQVVATSEELIPAAERMAERIISCAPLAIRMQKEQVLIQFNQPIPVQVAMRDLGENIALSHDAEEGVSAFVEKRKPVWKGE